MSVELTVADWEKRLEMAKEYEAMVKEVLSTNWDVHAGLLTKKIERCLAEAREKAESARLAASEAAKQPRPDELPKEAWGLWNIRERRLHIYFERKSVLFPTHDDAEEYRGGMNHPYDWCVVRLFPRPDQPEQDETTRKLIAAAIAWGLVWPDGTTRKLYAAINAYLATHPEAKDVAS